MPTTIGIIGDFNPDYPLHPATGRSIGHAAASLGVEIGFAWLATNTKHDFGRYQGLWCSPGSPYKSMEGALAGIRTARTRAIPFLGTCGGFQHAVLEYGRDVLQLSDAAHAEYDPNASVLFVNPLSCSLAGKTMQVSVRPGSRAHACYESERAEEAYYCNFGLNPAYQQPLEDAGLAITGSDETGEARIVEIPSHPFFMGTLFVPQARSEPGAPHPLITGFCRAVAGL